MAWVSAIAEAPAVEADGRRSGVVEFDEVGEVGVIGVGCGGEEFIDADGGGRGWG
jgi:hypothetical protein